MTYILGIFSNYYDSAVALLLDGKIIIEAQEVRISRKKHDPNYPQNATKLCLKEKIANWKKLITLWKIIFSKEGGIAYF